MVTFYEGIRSTLFKYCTYKGLRSLLFQSYLTLTAIFISCYSAPIIYSMVQPYISNIAFLSPLKVNEAKLAPKSEGLKVNTNSVETNQVGPSPDITKNQSVITILANKISKPIMDQANGNRLEQLTSLFEIIMLFICLLISILRIATLSRVAMFLVSYLSYFACLFILNKYNIISFSDYNPYIFGLVNMLVGLSVISKSFDGGLTGEAILFVAVFLNAILLWWYKAILSVAFLVPVLAVMFIASRYRKSLNCFFILLVWILFMVAYYLARTNALKAMQINILSSSSNICLLLFLSSYFVLSLVLFNQNYLEVDDNIGGTSNSMSQTFYAVYGTIFGQSCLYMMSISAANYWLFIFSGFAFAVPSFYITLEYFHDETPVSERACLYISNLTAALIFALQLYQASFTNPIILEKLYLSVGVILASIFIIPISMAASRLSKARIGMTCFSFSGYVLLLPMAFLVWALQKKWMMYFCLGAGITIQCILFLILTKVLDAQYVLILYQALSDFRSFLFERQIDAEERTFFNNIYSMQYIERPKDSPLTIGELIRWQDTEFNPLYRLIEPARNLLCNGKNNPLVNVIRSFISQYSDRIVFEYQDTEVQTLTDFNFDQLMNVQIKSIFPYLLLEIPKKFYTDNLFRQIVVNGGILNYIFGEHHEPDFNIFRLDNVPDAAIAAKCKDDIAKYTNGYSAPVIDYYATHDEQIREELCRARISRILPSNIIGVIRSDSVAFSQINDICVNNPLTSELVLYKPKAAKDNSSYLFLEAEDGQIDNANSVLETYTKAITSLAGKVINMQKTFDGLLKTGSVSLITENQERRINVLSLFALMVVDANFEMEYSNQAARVSFLRGVARSLLANMGTPGVDLFSMSSKDVDYESAGADQYKFLFYKSVFEPIFQYSGLGLNSIEYDETKILKSKIQINSSDMSSVYALDPSWSDRQLNSISSLLNSDNRKLFFDKIKTLYQYGRMYLYMIRSRMIDSRFIKNYGRYFIMHKTHKNETGLSVNLDNFMQSYSSIQLTMPVFIKDNYEPVDDVALTDFINQYIDRYIIKLIMDSVWYEVYLDTRSSSFSTNAYEPYGTTRLTNIGTNFSDFIVDYGYDKFEEQFKNWINSYFDQVFIPALIVKVQSILKTQNKFEKLYYGHEENIDKIITDIANNYRHEYIINLHRFNCMKFLSGKSIKIQNHDFLSPDKEYSPALLYNLGLDNSNFRYFIYQQSEMKADSAGLSNIASDPSSMIQNIQRRICDSVCFKVRHNEKISADALHNRVAQNFMYTNNIVPMFQQSQLSIRSTIKLDQPRLFDDADLPMINETISVGKAETKDAVSKIRYAGFAEEFTQTLHTECSHYVIEDCTLQEETRTYLNESCLINKSAKIDVRGDISQANLCTAFTVSQFADFIANGSDMIIAHPNRLYDFQISKNGNMFGFFDRPLNGVSTSIPINADRNIFIRPDSLELFGQSFSKHILKHVKNFMTANSARYEYAKIQRFDSAESTLDIAIASVPISNTFIIGKFNPFESYNSIEPQINPVYCQLRFMWVNLIKESALASIIGGR